MKKTMHLDGKELRKAGKEPGPFIVCLMMALAATNLPSATAMTTTPTSYCSLDVIFILDSSMNITEANFYTIKYWTANMAKTMSEWSGVGPRGMQFSLVVFNTNPRLIFDLAQSTDLARVVSMIDSVKYTTGTTNTAAALDMARTNVIGQAGDRDDSRYPDIVIIVTDGEHTPGTEDPKVAADKIRTTGTQIIAVGVTGLNPGAEIIYEELEGIAGSKSRVFNVTDYDKLYPLINHIIASLNCTRHCYGDILFIIETSELIGEPGFRYIQSAVMDITKALHVGKNWDYVGLAHFSSNNYKSAVLFPIWDWTVKDVKDFIYGPKMDWIFKTIIGVCDLKTGLELGIELINNAWHRDQDSDYRFVVLFAQGYYDEGPPPFETARRLRDEKHAEIFAVEMPPRNNTVNLKTITSKTDHIYKMGDHMSIAKRINDLLSATTCGPPPPPCNCTCPP